MMMKTTYMYGLFALFLISGMLSCKQHTPVRNTVTGYVADATMNNIMLITNENDTLNISTMDSDPEKVPGVLLRDSVEITYTIEKMGENELLKAEELKVTTHSPYYYIQGTWVEPNPINPSEVQGMTLQEGGTAVSVGMATLVFKEWTFTDNQLMLKAESIGNKQTLTGTDTLQVVKLNADSLILARSGEIVWKLGRKK